MFDKFQENYFHRIVKEHILTISEEIKHSFYVNTFQIIIYYIFLRKHCSLFEVAFFSNITIFYNIVLVKLSTLFE
jgi:hypothetical protein